MQQGDEEGFAQPVIVTCVQRFTVGSAQAKVDGITLREEVTCNGVGMQPHVVGQLD